MREVAITETGIGICGLPWFAHNGEKLWRLPKELEGVVSEALWGVAKNTSGARLRFASDTAELGIAANYSPYERCPATTNICGIGQNGMDLYGEGKFWANVWPQDAAEVAGYFFYGLPRQRREFAIYLPLYHQVEIEHLMFSDDAEIWPAAPFALPKPVVFYGTSLTQGGCASRAGMSYQGILGRALNLDFVNLGFSGLGKGEPVVAQAIAQLDAACFVLDYAQNNPTVEEFAAVYQPFLDILREAHPDTPIVMTTPIYYTSELFVPGEREHHESRREVVRAAYRTQLSRGDKHIYILEGKDYLSDGEGQVDGGHANDLGFFRMAEALAPVLKQALALK